MYFIAGLKHLCSLKVREDFQKLGQDEREEKQEAVKKCGPRGAGFELIARIWGQKSTVVLEPIGEIIGTVCMHSSW